MTLPFWINQTIAKQITSPQGALILEKGVRCKPFPVRGFQWNYTTYIVIMRKFLQHGSVFNDISATGIPATSSSEFDDFH